MHAWRHDLEEGLVAEGVSFEAFSLLALLVLKYMHGGTTWRKGLLRKVSRGVLQLLRTSEVGKTMKSR